MILTDDERLACWSKHTAAKDYDNYSLKDHVIRALREHEAAIIEKLEGKLKDAAYERAAALIDNRHWSVDSGKRFAMAIRELKGTGVQLSGNSEQLIKVLDDVRQTLRYIPSDRVADECEINAAIVKINEVLK